MKADPADATSHNYEKVPNNNSRSGLVPAVSDWDDKAHCIGYVSLVLSGPVTENVRELSQQ